MIADENRNGSAVHRAPRFPIEAPVRFRESFESTWHDGWTTNVSRSGVLFWCDKILKRGAGVKMELTLPHDIFGEPGAEVECQGRIVRVEPPRGVRAEVAVAATITNYRFIRGTKK